MPQPPIIPSGFKHRSHYSKAGLPKKILTIHQAQALLTENPAMEMYTCHICRRIHVGHRPRKEVKT